MNISDKVAVCSRSFSRNEYLRNQLLTKYKNVKFNDESLSLKDESLVNFLKGSTKAITALETINDDILKQLPELRVIGKYGVGLDMLDFNSFEKNNVKLGWTPGVNKESVAELVISLSINLLRGIHHCDKELRQSIWKQFKGLQLSSVKFGIIGLGNVGKQVYRYLQPFGCEVSYFDIHDKSDFEKENTINKKTLDDLLSTSDIISIHVPKNEETINLIGGKELKLMKNTSFLINTARGGIVNEDSLLNAINSEEIAGAALDVFATEPDIKADFIDHSKIIITPHIGEFNRT